MSCCQVAFLHKMWLSPVCPSLCSPRLKPLVVYLRAVVKTLELRKEGGHASEGLTSLARRVKRMLVTLHELDEARSVAKLFDLREAV